MTQPLIITPGEPAGIGPDLVITLAQQSWPAAITVIADPDMLRERAINLKLPLTLHEVDEPASEKHTTGSLHVIPIKTKTTVIAGKLDKTNASYVLETLSLAAAFCLQKKAHAIITGPVHKAVMNDAGIAFSGHTEFFAQQANVKRTVMLFVAEQMKVALATTHIPVCKVAETITPELLRQIIAIMHRGLKNQFGIKQPHILVCGLNPHAGENGHLGLEEIDVIKPALDKLRAQGFRLTGPLPADTIFTPAILKQHDAVLSMYHDQALPVVKYASFGNAVNVTLGLPFIRTSVDHGTALDIAGSGKANTGSLSAAIKLALALTPPSSND